MYFIKDGTYATYVFLHDLLKIITFHTIDKGNYIKYNDWIQFRTTCILPGIPSRPNLPGGPLGPASPLGPCGPGGPGGPVPIPIAGGPEMHTLTAQLIRAFVFAIQIVQNFSSD